MGKMVNGVIAARVLPTPGADLLVEQRFDGTARPEGEGRWPPLNTENTLRLGGVPWDGFVDLTFRRGDVPEVWDHKFVSTLDNARRNEALIKTVQMPVYVLAQLPRWPDAARWRIAHLYVSRAGVQSELRAEVVHQDEVLKQRERIETVVAQLLVSRLAVTQNEVPYNLRACTAYAGCPHQSRCSAFGKERVVFLSPEEAALFDAPLPTTPVVNAPTVARPLVVDVAPGEADTDALARHAASAGASVPTSTVCALCGEQVTRENGSRLQSGEWTHVIGCKSSAPAPSPAPSPAPEAKRRGRPPKVAQEGPPASALPTTPQPTTPQPTTPQPMAAQTLSVVPSTSEGRGALARLLEDLAALVRSLP